MHQLPDEFITASIALEIVSIDAAVSSAPIGVIPT